MRTYIGAIFLRLTLRAPETEFDRGVRRFGYLLSTTMLVMVLFVFAANMLPGALRSRRYCSRSRSSPAPRTRSPSCMRWACR